MTRGRPTVMTPEMQDAILMRVADGESVRHICEDEDMPARSTVYLAIVNNKDFSDRYAKASDAKVERWADEIISIADDGTNDWMERRDDDGKKTYVLNGEHINRSRLRVDTRKWVMSKLVPKKYGDRVVAEHSGKGGGPIEVTTDNPREVARAILAVLREAKIERPGP